MQYQEAIIKGFWSYKLYPNDPWTKFDAVLLKAKIQEFKDKMDDAKQQLEIINKLNKEKAEFKK